MLAPKTQITNRWGYNYSVPWLGDTPELVMAPLTQQNICVTGYCQGTYEFRTDLNRYYISCNVRCNKLS